MSRKPSRRVQQNVFARLSAAIPRMAVDRADHARARLRDPARYRMLTDQQRQQLIQLSLQVQSKPTAASSAPGLLPSKSTRPGSANALREIAAQYRLPPPPKVDSKLTTSVNRILRASTPGALVSYAQNVLVTAKRRTHDQKPARDEGTTAWLEAFFRARMERFPLESRMKTYDIYTKSKRYRHTTEQLNWFRGILQLPTH